MKNELGIKCKTPKTSDALLSDQKGNPKTNSLFSFPSNEKYSFFSTKTSFFFCQRIANLTAREQMYFLHEETLVLFCAPKNQHENFCNIVYTPNKMPAMAPFRSSFTVKRKISHGNYFSVCEVNIEHRSSIFLS